MVVMEEIIIDITPEMLDSLFGVVLASRLTPESASLIKEVLEKTHDVDEVLKAVGHAMFNELATEAIKEYLKENAV